MSGAFFLPLCGFSIFEQVDQFDNCFDCYQSRKILQFICRSNFLALYLYCEIKEQLTMPTILYIFGLRFYFYSDEHRPIHVHIEYGGNDAKIEIETRDVKYNRGIKAGDLRRALQIIEMYEADIIAKWHEYFGDEE